MNPFLSEDCLKRHIQYATGDVVEKDLDQSIFWLKKACGDSKDQSKKVRSFVRSELKKTLQKHRKRKLRHIQHDGVYEGIILNLIGEYCVQDISKVHVAVHSRSDITDLYPNLKIGDSVRIRYKRGEIYGFKKMS